MYGFVKIIFRTFNKILEIYDSNSENFCLEFFFESTGYAIIRKKNNQYLKKESKIDTNKVNFKNFLKKIYLRKPVR